jgi:hypothetical protein
MRQLERQTKNSNLTKKFVRIILLGVLFVSLFRGVSFAQPVNLDAVTAFIHTPEALSSWLTKNFRYEFGINDNWQTAEETLRLRTGDCEDFATLASVVLKKLGVQPEIAIVKYEGLNLRHAICIWKETDGTYSFISNQELHRTGESTVGAAIAKVYPDWQNLTYLDLNNHPIKIVKK